MPESIVIYTCQVGYVDRVKLYEPRIFSVDWIGFKKTKREFSRQEARKMKMVGHRYIPEEYDIYIWVDSKEEVISDIRPYVEKYLKDADWCCSTELPQYGTNIYTAALADVNNFRNSEEAVTKQLNRYRKEGVPGDFPIFKTPIVMRRRTPEVIEASEVWYEEYLRTQDPEYGFGDQVTLAYTSWKKKFRINRMTTREMYKVINRTPWTSDPNEFMRNELA